LSEGSRTLVLQGNDYPPRQRLEADYMRGGRIVPLPYNTFVSFAKELTAFVAVHIAFFGLNNL